MDTASTPTRAGYVAIVGRPNAGKSTLLNRLVGEKLAITSAKPQSTRDRVVGILTEGDTQAVFLDTPGLLEPRYALHESMRAAALEALADADVILYLVDASDLDDPALPPTLESVAGVRIPSGTPVITGLNKWDAVEANRRGRSDAGQRSADADGPMPDSGPGSRVIRMSAATGAGLDTLLETIRALLPGSPFLYPEDEISTRPVRFFVAEMVRETALEQLEDEVPYALACEIEEFREERRPVYIRATLYVERQSQRGIVIGAKGERLRGIGRAARAKIEALVGAPVYLDLWVKVLPNWRRDRNALRRLGYRLPTAPEP